ncbi:hypothetical protein RYX36_015565 [Vicia faba]
MGNTTELDVLTSQLQQTYKQVKTDETSMRLKDLFPVFRNFKLLYHDLLNPPREDIKLLIKENHAEPRFDKRRISREILEILEEHFQKKITGVSQNPEFTDDSDSDSDIPLSKLELEVALNKQYADSINDRDMVTYGVVKTVVVAASSDGGGISGIHPPLIKAPKLAPIREAEVGIDRVSLKREEEEGVVDDMYRIAEILVSLSESSLFSTTYNEYDSSRTAMEPRSNNVSPNGRIKLIIIPGCWQKGHFLGGGSFGSVYEGISDDGIFFAVKEVSLLDQGDQGKQSVYQLEQEIALLSRFEHDNIVQYYGTEMDESKLHIFIELVTGGSLRSLYQKYTLRDSVVSAYTRQILCGLKYLHDQNVVHRDIKCANILVHASGSVKLADFGLAKAIKLNDVKSCKGTAFWMAPEVVKGKNKGYGLPADVWSLGCTALEMLTGQIPYSNLECMQAIFRIGKGVLPPIPDTLSRDAKDFIMQCLQVNPDDRPTAAQLLNHPFLQRPLSQSSSPYIHGRRV